MTINVAPSVTDMWTESPTNIRNISSMKSKVEPSPHKVEVARIYDVMYIIHLNCYTGVGRLYSVF